MHQTRKVIYTSLTGGYDNLPQPLATDESFDYICFSNDIPQSKVGVWQIKPIPHTNKNKLIESRYVKLQPHKVLQDYDYSLWIDANIQIATKEIYQIINKKIEEKSLIAQVNHAVPYRDCIYEDIPACLHFGKVSLIDALRQERHLREEGFPEHYGLYENNLILRQHNNEEVVNIDNDWWREFLTYAKRDQFSLSYIYWKHSFQPDLLLPANICTRNSTDFNYTNHPQIRDDKQNNIIKRIQKKIRRTYKLDFYIPMSEFIYKLAS